MVVFTINDLSIDCEETKSILQAKQEIIKQLDVACKYIDISFVLDKPMRVLGKFNVEPGRLARTFDRHTLDKFAFKDSVQVTYDVINDYDPSVRKPLMSGGMGRGRGDVTGTYKPPVSSFDHTSLQQDMKLEPVYDLESNDDFPTLG